ncbi:hypothetical protein [Bathymodiolus japonicus methanotrophic gill symbiont]|uniref:hypothetical protein n=1 Tax=Bathymodiolus japonicus methanotrophic gill symbiont TaxID=113269 RepID=UPI001C8D201B|nr:hypothetical protein [Bathymodiolus japonicus methanotrophic gill symbiont]
MLLAHVESANCPVSYQGLKITTSLSSVSMIFSGGLPALAFALHGWQRLSLMERDIIVQIKSSIKQKS